MSKKHECEAIKEGLGKKFGWSLEDRGNGWYIYNREGARSEAQCNYCPCCGEKLEDA